VIESLLPFIGVAAFALVGVVVFRLIMADRERKAERAREAAAHGFRPMVPPDADVVERIVALHRRREAQALEVRSLHRKQADDRTLYLFDLVDRSDDRAGLDCDRAIAVVSPGLRLPRFSMVPRVEHEGKLAALANWLLERFAPRAGERVEFDGSPAFAERYTLAADDPAEARQFFTAERLAALAETHYWLLEGAGDMLTLDRLELDPARGRFGAHTVGERLRDAERAVAILSSVPAGR
jgi:hypothetical protein